MPSAAHSPGSGQDAAAFRLRHDVSGAPVVDEHGQGKGVLAMSDIARAVAVGLRGPPTQRSLEPREPVAGTSHSGLEFLSSLRVPDLMLPGIVTLRPEASPWEVLDSPAAPGVHRLFVLEERGDGLEGVITTTDVIGCLKTSGKGSRSGETLSRPL